MKNLVHHKKSDAENDYVINHVQIKQNRIKSSLFSAFSKNREIVMRAKRLGVIVVVVVALCARVHLHSGVNLFTILLLLLKFA